MIIKIFKIVREVEKNYPWKEIKSKLISRRFKKFI